MTFVLRAQAPRADGSRDLQAVTQVLQAMGVDDGGAAAAMVKFGVRSAGDISKLDQSDVNKLEERYGLAPLTAKKLGNPRQQASRKLAGRDSRTESK